jgi:arginyl-tRNA--protein-N-Asp/Glu arginylyltransferase
VSTYFFGPFHQINSWANNFPSYDPDYEQWEFGKLSALREIAFAQENGYPYYYMGQYM